jgi:hypothetical protein
MLSLLKMDFSSQEKDLSRQLLLKDTHDCEDGSDSDSGPFDDRPEFSLKRRKARSLDWLHFILFLGYLPFIFLNVFSYAKSRNCLVKQTCTHPDLIDCRYPLLLKDTVF